MTQVIRCSDNTHQTRHMWCIIWLSLQSPDCEALWLSSDRCCSAGEFPHLHSYSIYARECRQCLPSDRSNHGLTFAAARWCSQVANHCPTLQVRRRMFAMCLSSQQGQHAELGSQKAEGHVLCSSQLSGRSRAARTCFPGRKLGTGARKHCCQPFTHGGLRRQVRLQCSSDPLLPAQTVRMGLFNIMFWAC